MLLFVNGQNHHRSSSFRTRHNDHQASFATGTNYFHLSEYRKSQDPFEFSLLTIVLGFYCHATAKQELTFRYCSLHILRRLTGFFFARWASWRGQLRTEVQDYAIKAASIVPRLVVYSISWTVQVEHINISCPDILKGDVTINVNCHAESRNGDWYAPHWKGRRNQSERVYEVLC